MENSLGTWPSGMPDVSYKPAVVSFPAFEAYRDTALKAADYIRSTEVTEETLPDAKKVLAEARKVTDKLRDSRTSIKKEILRDFTDFESQVKEIEGIVSEADSDLRTKVHALEDQERQAKKEEIHKIFDKRVPQYRISELLPDAFNAWWHEDLANKSSSMKTAETDMVDWLEAREKDIETLSAMDDEYMVEYLGCLDLASAIQAVNLRNERRKAVSVPKDTEEVHAVFTVFGEKDIALAEMIFKANHINYRKDN